MRCRSEVRHTHGAKGAAAKHGLQDDRAGRLDATKLRTIVAWGGTTCPALRAMAPPKRAS